MHFHRQRCTVILPDQVALVIRSFLLLALFNFTSECYLFAPLTIFSTVPPSSLSLSLLTPLTQLPLTHITSTAHSLSIRLLLAT